jgi:hypothetical protein
MKEIDIPEMASFNGFVRDLRILLIKYSPILPEIQRALSMIFNEKKEKK